MKPRSGPPATIAYWPTMKPSGLMPNAIVANAVTMLPEASVSVTSNEIRSDPLIEIGGLAHSASSRCVRPIFATDNTTIVGRSHRRIDGVLRRGWAFGLVAQGTHSPHPLDRWQKCSTLALRQERSMPFARQEVARRCAGG
jgi:hypothetical protein